MQVSVKKSGDIERRLTVLIPHQEVHKEIEKRLIKVAKQARIPGFRPGKAPQGIINKRYSAQITNEVVSDTINTSYREALDEKEIVPAGLLSLEPKPFVAGDDLQYTATVELYPKIPSPTLSGIKIEKPICEITDEDVERTLQDIRIRNADFIATSEKSVKGDRVTIDFNGTIDGKQFAGSAANDHQFVLGEGRMLKQFDSGLLSVVAGNRKQITVAFEADYHSAEVAGKKAKFEVVVKSVERPQMDELGDAFAVKLGISTGGMEKMRTEIKVNMQRELANRERAVLRDRVMSALLKANQISAPKSLVEAEIDHRVKLVKEQMAGETPEVAREPFTKEAQRQVLLGLIVREIIKKHHIVVDEATVRARIEEQASSYDDSETMIKWYYAEPSRLRTIEAMALEEQVVGHMLKTATVTEKKVLFKEFMDRQSDSKS